MGFFDSLVPTEQYQAQTLAKQSGGQGTPIPKNVAPIQQPNMASAGLPGMQPQRFAKGGLAAANEQIEQSQIMKVIANYFKNQGLPVEAAMAGVKREVSNGLQLIPYESSVMGFKQLGQGIAQIHFFTVGTMQNLADDMQYFYQYLKNKGINTIYDSIPAPITTQMFQKLGAKLEESDNPKYKFKARI
jgi:hypothetical protein